MGKMVDSLGYLEASANRDLKIVDSLECLEASAKKDVKIVDSLYLLDCLEAIANRDLKIVDSLDCLEPRANRDLKIVKPWGGKIRNFIPVHMLPLQNGVFSITIFMQLPQQNTKSFHHQFSKSPI
jgi:hypothetical protein